MHNNVIVANDRIVAVIDWGCARFGDFLHDVALFSFYAPWFPFTAGIDWIDHAKRHYLEIGLDVPDIDERVRCYEVHIGLEGMAYSAFTEDWSEVQAHANRTLGIIRGA